MHVHEHRVDPDAWLSHCTGLAAAGAAMLDMLTAVDDPGKGRIEVVAHLVDVPARERHLVWTAVDRAAAALASLVGLYPGAAWHEREVHEMFGVTFVGNPDLRPLLTTGDAGHPLRRTTALPARMATPWPGAVEPADRPADGRGAARPRSRPGPPGVPPEWQL
ncbi:MAG TPA: NADH-quinone oxidoreductase subunit C [Motilibacterales bacterium]|nr:NADH-quinone oxidoreductase subunit C [Motilibacterales bacterium]